MAVAIKHPSPPLLLVLTWLLFSGTASSRDIPRPDDKGAGLLGECWYTLWELKSCTNEIILFFINGETFLGMDCCKAIRAITYLCWPTILSTFGYTSEEGDLLRGYCTAPPPEEALSETLAEKLPVDPVSSLP